MMSRISIFVLAALLSGCAGHKSPVASPAQATNWRAIITEADHVRLRDWREAFTASIAAARKAGNGLSIDREGVLLDCNGEPVGTTRIIVSAYRRAIGVAFFNVTGG